MIPAINKDLSNTATTGHQNSMSLLSATAPMKVKVRLLARISSKRTSTYSWICTIIIAEILLRDGTQFQIRQHIPLVFLSPFSPNRPQTQPNHTTRHSQPNPRFFMLSRRVIHINHRLIPLTGWKLHGNVKRHRSTQRLPALANMAHRQCVKPAPGGDF